MDALRIIEIASTILLFLLLIGSAFTDIAYGKIFNWLTIPAMICGMALNTVLGGFSGESLYLNPSFLFSLCGILVSGGILIPFYLSGGTGAGDIKLMAAIGAIKGWVFALHALFYGALFGCGIAIIMLIQHGMLRQGLIGSLRILMLPSASRIKASKESPTGKIKVPYGAAIALGTMVAWFMSQLR